MKGIEKFRQKLRDKQDPIGASITFTDPLVTDALADSVDFFWIDLEHCTMSPESLAGHLLAARGKGVAALVRVPHYSTPYIKSVLDAGAEGIIVPQIRSAAEVEQIVRDCRYYPEGQRGYGPRVPSNYGRSGGMEYMQQSNRNVFVTVQIETWEALNSLDDILQVQGLDSLVIGPWDLSISLEVPGEVEHTKVESAIDHIISKTHASGLTVGIGMGADPDYALKMFKRGVDWAQVGNDYSYLIRSIDEISLSVRGRL